MRSALLLAVAAVALVVGSTPSRAASLVPVEASAQIAIVAASASFGGASVDSILPHPVVQDVRICPREGCFDPPKPICAGDSFYVVLRGLFPNGCYRFDGAELYYPPDTSPRHAMPWVRVRYTDHTCEGPCPLMLVPLRASVLMPPLSAGTYQLHVVEQPSGCDSLPFLLEPVTFTVVDSCDSLPPPGPLPYVDAVTICPNQPARGVACGPICPRDSIAVLISGTFPNGCYRVSRVDVLPPPPSFREAAPILRVVVQNGCCILQLCTPQPQNWNAVVKLPPMSAGPYDLQVMVAELCCTDSVPPIELPTAHFPFAVSGDCGEPPPEACLWGGWMHTNDESCDAYLTFGQPATVTFGINSTVRLAGLQGELTLSWPIPAGTDPAFRPQVARLTPVGDATGMRLSWTRTEHGARFVLFADEGAPIPASPPFEGPRVPVLAVMVELPAFVDPASAGTDDYTPPEIAVSAFDLLGADALGRGVPVCPVRDNVRIAYDRARICTSVGCDFNNDGRADVRDLVTMVRCLRSDSCSGSPRFDCDHDGGFDIDDVLCCARHVIGRPPCNICPPDSTPPRKEPSVKLVLDSPTITGVDVLAPVSISGTERIGGARLELRFPSDRYEFVSFDGTGDEWLALVDADRDAIVIGLIRIAEPPIDDFTGVAHARGVLRLRLKPGQSPGGELATAAAEFSGPDGVHLEVPLDARTQPLSEGLAFALSDNRPDPFSGTTRFTLTLPSAGDADLGVFDVGGRRIATVHRGRLAAGVNEFAWDARSSDGGRVASGVYFYRATVAGKTLSKKMVVLTE